MVRCVEHDASNPSVQPLQTNQHYLCVLITEP